MADINTRETATNDGLTPGAFPEAINSYDRLTPGVFPEAINLYDSIYIVALLRGYSSMNTAIVGGNTTDYCGDVIETFADCDAVEYYAKRLFYRPMDYKASSSRDKFIVIYFVDKRKLLFRKDERGGISSPTWMCP